MDAFLRLFSYFVFNRFRKREPGTSRIAMAKCFYPGCDSSSVVQSSCAKTNKIHRVPYNQKKAVAQKLNIADLQLPFVELCELHLPACAFTSTDKQKSLRRDVNLAELLETPKPAELPLQPSPIGQTEMHFSKKRKFSNVENGELEIYQVFQLASVHLSFLFSLM